MGAVIQFRKPIDLSLLVAALRDITDDETEAIMIVTVSPTRIATRTFGDFGDVTLDDMSATLSDVLMKSLEK